MPDNRWKRFEREICKALGGIRTGPRGYGLPDCKGLRIGIECKSDRHANLETAHIQQAVQNAEALGLPWVLVYKELRGRKLAIMDFETLALLYNIAFYGRGE